MPAGIIDPVLQVLSNLESALINICDDTKAYESILTELGHIVQRSASDEEYRLELASSEELWNSLRLVLNKGSDSCDKAMQDKETAIRYVRMVRGVVLLMRNMSASNQQLPRQLLLQNQCISTFLRIAELSPCIDEMMGSYYAITVSLLHNITKEMSACGLITKPLMRFLEFPHKYLVCNYELSYCYATFFLNLTANDEFLYNLFKEELCSKILSRCLLSGICKQHTVISKHLAEANPRLEEYEITSLDAAMLKIFSSFAVNESFSHYLISLEKENVVLFFELLRCLQLVVTSSEKWDKFELTAMMTWCYPLLQEAAKAAALFLEAKTENEQEAASLHNKLTIILDILSTVTQYEQVQKFLLAYDALEVLITLLRALQNNLIHVNFYKNPNGTIKGIKASDAVGNKLNDDQLLSHRIDYDNFQIKATNFPECKLLIIEILTMLVHSRREVQDKIRELAGLELVFSNCVIDDNDPFIKERSVVCIKFLLNDNAANQDFVAKLEAKKVVQDDALSAAGYEVKVSGSGELSLGTIPQNQ